MTTEGRKQQWRIEKRRGIFSAGHRAQSAGHRAQGKNDFYILSVPEHCALSPEQKEIIWELTERVNTGVC